MKLFHILILFMAGIISCNQAPEKRPATSTDTGRDFIRSTLDGNFKEAQSLLLNDSANKELFESYKNYYQRLSPEKKSAYKNASYIINTFTDVNDSVALINYSNTYMKMPQNIKLVKKDKAWFVDFTYTSEDTTGIK